MVSHTKFQNTEVCQYVHIHYRSHVLTATTDGTQAKLLPVCPKMLLRKIKRRKQKEMSILRVIMFQKKIVLKSLRDS